MSIICWFLMMAQKFLILTHIYQSFDFVDSKLPYLICRLKVLSYKFSISFITFPSYLGLMAVEVTSEHHGTFSLFTLVGCLFFFTIWRQSHTEVQTGPEVELILLPPKCWDYRHGLLYLDRYSVSFSRISWGWFCILLVVFTWPKWLSFPLEC